VGIPSLYVEQFLKQYSEQIKNVTLISDHSQVLAKAYNEGHLDVVCMRSPEFGFSNLIEAWGEPLSWVRSRSFILGPGKPIPLVSWPSDDQPAVNALDAAGQQYRIAFKSPDHDTRMKAVAAGLGIMATPARQIKISELVIIANDYYLPELPSLEFRVFAIPEKLKDFPVVPNAMKSLAPPHSSPRKAFDSR
jgi:DNA-binding transcriptional LysR family regulator